MIREVRAEGQVEWSRMRTALWPEEPAASLSAEAEAYLRGDLASWLVGLEAVTVFVAERPGGGLCGFVEVSIRAMADGCATPHVGYVEGWYVDPDVRQQGVGRLLVEAAETWAGSRGCQEMASDAYMANSTSISAHEALGFEALQPIVPFRKWLRRT